MVKANRLHKIETQIGPIAIRWANTIQGYKGDEIMGAFNTFKYEIAVKKDLPLGIRRQTLLHELIHMLQYNAGMKFSEQQADILASGIYALLKDNKKLVKFLLEDN